MKKHRKSSKGHSKKAKSIGTILAETDTRDSKSPLDPAYQVNVMHMRSKRLQLLKYQ